MTTVGDMLRNPSSVGGATGFAVGKDMDIDEGVCVSCTLELLHRWDRTISGDVGIGGFVPLFGIAILHVVGILLGAALPT